MGRPVVISKNRNIFRGFMFIRSSSFQSLTRTLTTKTNYDPLESLAQRRRRNPFVRRVH